MVVRVPSEFETAVLSTPELAASFRSGKQALTAEHKAQVDDDGAVLHGSVDVDHALMATHPNSHRWDYAIAHTAVDHDGEFVTWVEVHPAKPGGVAEILNKRAALDQWLDGNGRLLARFPREYVWVASGSVGIPKNSPDLRKLALRSIKGPCKYYRLRRRQCS